MHKYLLGGWGLIHEEAAVLPTVGMEALCSLDCIFQLRVPLNDSAPIRPVPVILILLEPRAWVKE